MLMSESVPKRYVCNQSAHTAKVPVAQDKSLKLSSRPGPDKRSGTRGEPAKQDPGACS
jgi:hypothetical protein